MKFLVFALCVCAASAATFTPFGKQQVYQPFQPQQAAKAFVQTVAVPTAVVGNSAYAAAKVIAETPVVAAKAAYDAGKQVYAKDIESTVLRADSEVNPDGFNYYYETSNGIAAQSSGVTKKVGNDDVLAIQGSYKYRADDGREIVVSYVADENGYQPQSDVLPVGPEIPDYIVRSLEYIRTHYKPEPTKY